MSRPIGIAIVVGGVAVAICAGCSYVALEIDDRVTVHPWADLPLPVLCVLERDTYSVTISTPESNPHVLVSIAAEDREGNKLLVRGPHIAPAGRVEPAPGVPREWFDSIDFVSDPYLRGVARHGLAVEALSIGRHPHRCATRPGSIQLESQVA